jgi:hypothetical protein
MQQNFKKRMEMQRIALEYHLSSLGALQIYLLECPSF